MRVAIIGAGLSSMACAHELKRYGIVPTIFERTHFVGGNLNFPVAWLNIFIPERGDAVKYLMKNYNINLKPFTKLKEFEMNGPTKNLIVKADLGYIFRRQPYNDSLESQIVQNYNPPILFKTYVNPEDIKNDFDYVVVATASSSDATALGVFTTTYDSYVRVANISGNFKIDSIKLWFNTEYAKNSYAYLVAVDSKEARFALIVDNISHNELDYYWKKFFEIEEFPYKILSIRDVEHRVGFVYPPQKDNILLIGNAGGFIDNVLGFGSMRAIMSGVMAARSIACNLDYTKIAEPIIKDIRKKNEFRKVLNTFENKDYDRLITFLGLPVVKQFVYHNPFFNVTQGTILARLYNKVKK